jgi:HEAT repeat protein
MRRSLLIAFLLGSAALLQAELADSGLNAELRKIFPELQAGYIDLNGNGKADRTEDLDEYVPQSGAKDGALQSRDVLAFIVRSYELIPAETLRKVLAALDSPVGPFSELTSLEYHDKVVEAIRKKEELDAKGLFLTPSARREAADRMSGYLAILVSTYTKEARALEPDFIKARDELFAMIERGYPLPDDLGADNAAILQRIMINTIVRERSSNLARVKIAVKTLGRLKVASATGYLVDLFGDAEVKRPAIAALGEIGNPEALAALMQELGRKNDTPTRIELVHAIGRVGDRESVARLQEILKGDGSQAPEPDLVLAVMEALVAIAQRGSPDPAMLTTFAERVASPVLRLRVLAVQGLGSYPQNPKVPDILFPLLTEKQPEEVMVAAVKAVNGLQSPRTLPALTGLLRSQDATDAEREAALVALGSNANGLQAVANIVQALESSSAIVGRAAAEALVTMYPKQPDQIVSAVGRSLSRSTDPTTLARGTEVLSRLADEGSLPFLVPLLTSQYAEVKVNVTWALYRIRSSSNAKALEDLKTLVKSETEALQVRINAVRALGAIRHDTPQLKVWEALVNTTRMTGEKYGMLRYYAVRALGELGEARPEVLDTLLRIASRDTNPEVVKEAVRALQYLATVDPNVEDVLARAYRRFDDPEVKARVVEALADLGSATAVDLAAPLMATDADPGIKRRVISAVARIGSEAALNLVLDGARDQRLAGFAKGVLEDADRKALRAVLTGRAKSETNAQVSAVIQELLDAIEGSL